jgi:hypothetical protein
MTDNDQMTVAQRALQMPEIISMTFTWIFRDKNSVSHEDDWDDDYGTSRYHKKRREGNLLRCGLVNKLWFVEAMPFLWSNPTLLIDGTSRHTLPKRLAKIDSTRKQIYANFVQEAVLATFQGPRVNECEALFRGLKFPRLQCLEMSMGDLENGFNVPGIRNHAIVSLKLFPVLEISYDWGQHPQIVPILEQIPVSQLFGGPVAHIAHGLHFCTLEYVSSS